MHSMCVCVIFPKHQTEESDYFAWETLLLLSKTNPAVRGLTFGEIQDDFSFVAEHGLILHKGESIGQHCRTWIVKSFFMMMI
jgi:hypothetical protein